MALATTELFSEFWLWRFNCVALKPAIFLVFVELCSPLVEVVVSLTDVKASGIGQLYKFSLQAVLKSYLVPYQSKEGKEDINAFLQIMS